MNLGVYGEPAGGAQTATIADVKAGTDTYKPVTSASLYGAINFSEYFQSADQVITNAGALTIAHGLGRVPILVQGFLRNSTAEANYSIGDVTPVPLGSSQSGTGNPKGNAITYDATNIYVRYTDGGGGANAFLVVDKLTGGTFTITNANWRFFLRAWA